MNFNWLLGLAVLGCKLAKGGGEIMARQVMDPRYLQAKGIMVRLEAADLFLRTNSQIIQNEAMEIEVIVLNNPNMSLEEKAQIYRNMSRIIRDCKNMLTSFDVMVELKAQIENLMQQLSEGYKQLLQTRLAEMTLMSTQQCTAIKIMLQGTVNRLKEKQRELE
ncbi:hypothetical protein BdWA1_000631 [Babesia duncani]|uniref:Uncharacterized protein n=1 Tax=Babesia duncani TaxID=323732 RepID=A0AAD9UM71_9APIC|nr:hypothetical protein BdWA1_003957 [Babesia duncani]KAK2197628.1 hypothetical protein BdWA1_000631 [Babesia duncani]